MTTASAAAAIGTVRLAAAQQAVAKPSATSVDESKVKAAREVQRSTIVVDGLDGAGRTQGYLDMLKSGGVDCWHQSLGGLASFASLLTFLDEHSKSIVQAGTVHDIKRAHEQGKMSHVSGWQMADPLILDANGVGPTENLRAYRQLGLRIASIAYNNSNIFGGGCLDPDVPLTRLGQKYIEALHKNRILVDVGGHTGERTSFDAIEISKGVPIICSHTNARALMDNPRNATDRLIEAIAKTGGVIGLTSVSDFHMRSRKDAAVQRSPQATLDKLMEHFDHLKKLVGVDHIGLGPDFMTFRSDLDAIGMDRERWPADVYSDQPWNMVRGFETIVELPNVTQALLDRGWSAGEVRKVLGENWLRVYEQAWGA
ncbi:MAG: membrane dipeptidase [Gemmatimonadaceae bacterium]